MKINSYFKRVCCAMLAMMFSLTGCNTSQEASDTEVTSSRAKMAYEDSVFDREKVEGKFAVYYLTSGLSISSWKNQVAGGDAIIMIFPDGTTALLDCGHQGEAAHVLNRLEELGIDKLDYFIMSHPHTDHVGGYRLILRYMEIGHVYIPPVELMPRGDHVSLDIMDTLEERNLPYTSLQAGDEFEIAKDVKVKVYNPTPEFAANTSYNVNESSLLMKFTYKDSSYLMNGDICNNTVKSNGYPTEEMLVEKWGDELQADVSKVGHHGNADAMSTDTWRNAVNAKIYCTLSTFPRSLTEHMAWAGTGALSLNTALDGDFVIYTSGDGTYDVQVSQDRIVDGYEILDTEDGYVHVE